MLTELFNDVVELSSDSLLVLDNIPVTYLSLNDFLNLINELRTFPDISSYFMARRMLPSKYLQKIGVERSYLEYYLQNSESFIEWNTSFEVKSNYKQNSDWEKLQSSRLIKQRNASILEFVSDALAT